MNMQRKNTHIYFLTLLLCLASSFFAANSHAQEDYPVAMTEAISEAALSCETATNKNTKLNTLQSMLVQVGLYLNNEEYQSSKTLISKDKAQLIDGKADETTKKWLKVFCDTLPEDKQADVLQQLMISSAFVTLASECAALKDLSTNIDVLRENAASAVTTIEALNSCLITLHSPAATPMITEDSSQSQESLKELASKTKFTADCDCVKQLAYKTVNYHVFSKDQLPPLPKEDEPINNIKIDYSNISRIAYDGVKIKQNGKITLNGWQKEFEISFISQAHRHYSKVDLFVEIDNWKTSTEFKTDEQINNIYNAFFSNHSLSLTEYLFNNSTRLDGLTLIFNTLTSEPDDIGLKEQAKYDAGRINDYIELGLEKFSDFDKNIENRPQLNILLDLASCLKDDNCVENYATELYKNLKTCPNNDSEFVNTFDQCPKGEPAVKYILITMPEDFEQGTQRLFDTLNSAYGGGKMGEVFLQILPIIEPNSLVKDSNNHSLVDAVSFGKDVFGGNAYWPMTLKSEDNYEEVNDIIGKTEDPENVPVAKILIDLVPFNICRFVCTERVIFRTLFVSYFALLIFLAFAKQESCVLCSIIENYNKTYIAMWLLLFASFIAWLGCDDLWKNYQEEALLIALGAILVWQAISSFTSSSKYVP